MKLFTVAFIALFLCLSPWDSTARNIPRPAVQPRTYGNFGPRVPRSFQTVKPSGVAINDVDPVTIAVEYFARQTNSPVSSIKVSSSHKSRHNGVTHVYLRQIINNLEVVNGVGNVNVDKNGQIVSVGNSFYSGPVPAAANLSEKHTASDAVHALGKLLGKQAGNLRQVQQIRSTTPVFSVSGASFALKEIPAALKYIQSGTKLSLVWDLQVEMTDNMYNAFVGVDSNQVVSLIDWVSDASYNVYPVGVNDPLSGDRALLENPAHPVASPNGWHFTRNQTYTVTIGNNVYAQENLSGDDTYLSNYRPDGGSELAFDFPIDLTKEPETYLDAVVTNLFYWNNIIHDLFYVYGFNEEAGNFQEINWTGEGKGVDAVIANAQDGSGYNNANFMTPPDGSKGRMRMYVWTQTDPMRDGDLDSGIIIHEYAHGISNRLTGGGDNVGCLGYDESGGMGEGWGDIIATVIRTDENTDRNAVYGMGDYSNGGEGIRKFMYSTDMSLNPTTYSFVTQSGYTGVHAKGEVWAVILYEVYWNLVEKHGFDADWYNVTPEPKGNVLFIQLLIDGMKLQPCEPNFVDARDAIIQADELNNNGENKCELWRGFAKRGLGTGARFEGIESFDLPEECQA